MEKPETIPVKSIRAWLKGTNEGRAILREEVEKRLPEAMGEYCERCKGNRPGVLIVKRGDEVDVYCHPRINAHIARLLDDADTELAEEYLSRNLPPWAVELYVPVYHRTIAENPSKTFEDEKRRLLRMAIMETLVGGKYPDAAVKGYAFGRPIKQE